MVLFSGEVRGMQGSFEASHVVWSSGTSNMTLVRYSQRVSRTQSIFAKQHRHWDAPTMPNDFEFDAFAR